MMTIGSYTAILRAIAADILADRAIRAGNPDYRPTVDEILAVPLNFLFQPVPREDGLPIVPFAETAGLTADAPGVTMVFKPKDEA